MCGKRRLTTGNVILRTRRDRILSRLVSELQRDERVKAAWLGGSFGRGTEDDWSDLDLHAAIDDACFDAWLASREDLFHRAGNPVLIRNDKPSNTGNGVFQGVIFEGPVCVDLDTHPASAMAPGPESLLLFDRRSLPPNAPVPIDLDERRRQLGDRVTHFWAMTPIALKYVVRGHADRGVLQLDLLLGAFVATWRLVHDPKRRDAGGAHWLHPVHDAALAERLPQLGPMITPVDVFGAISRLMDEMITLHPAIDAAGAGIPDAAVDEMRRFRTTVRDRLAGMEE